MQFENFSINCKCCQLLHCSKQIHRVTTCKTQAIMLSQLPTFVSSANLICSFWNIKIKNFTKNQKLSNLSWYRQQFDWCEAIYHFFSLQKKFLNPSRSFVFCGVCTFILNSRSKNKISFLCDNFQHTRRKTRLHLFKYQTAFHYVTNAMFSFWNFPLSGWYKPKVWKWVTHLLHTMWKLFVLAEVPSTLSHKIFHAYIRSTTTTCRQHDGGLSGHWKVCSSRLRRDSTRNHM